MHTGAPAWVRLLPSIEPGFTFKGPCGQAVVGVASVIDTQRCTVLDIDGHRLSTVEHLMAALAGMRITDAIIEFDGPEVPIMDGSAGAFVSAIDEAGMAVGPNISPVVLKNPVEAQVSGSSYIVALPAARFSVTVLLEYPQHAKIGVQVATFDDVDFKHSIAPARTYGFLSEFEQVRSLGLASGASLQNCIALDDAGSADVRTPLRFDNELARHKLLDVLGDLALIGRPLQAQIVALRPSHAVNCSLAWQIAALIDDSR